MSRQLSSLLRQTWFRILAALWLAVLAGGTVAVLRRDILASVLGAGFAQTGSRPALALVAALIVFAIGLAAMHIAFGRGARGPRDDDECGEPIPEAFAEREADPQPEGPLPAAEEALPAATTDQTASPEEPFSFGDDQDIAIRPDPSPAMAGAMREVWLMQTGESLGTPAGAPVAAKQGSRAANPPSDAPPVEDQAEGPAQTNPADAAPFLPSLTQLEKRLAEAITRLDQAAPDEPSEPEAVAEPYATEANEAPLLDEETRKAVERALAKLEGFTRQQ